MNKNVKKVFIIEFVTLDLSKDAMDKWIGLLVITISSLVQANEPALPTSAEPPPWGVSIPAQPTKFDWLMVKKGEVFGGDIIAMYDERVEFDSDEVGVHKIKMKDIAQLRTKDIVSVRLVDGRIIDGYLIITEDHFYLRDTPQITYPRSELLTISPSSKGQTSLWDGKLAAGINLKSGNSESFDYYFSADLKRLSAHGRLILGYQGIYEKVRDVASGGEAVTQDNHRVFASYDYYFSKKTYFRLPTFEFVTDELKNIDTQTTLGVAVGYEVIDKPGIDLNVYAGPSVQYTEYVAVQPGEQNNIYSPVFAFGFDYEYDITSDIECFLVYDGKWVNQASGLFIQRIETGFDIELIDDFDLELITIIDKTAKPVANEAGVTPEATDLLFTVGLEYEF